MMNKHLAKLQKELDISDTHNMPSTDIILKNVNNKINVSPEERKIYMKRKYLKITSIAAVICALAVTTAFAADSISGKIGEIISYFQNDNAVEMTSLEQLANFNDSIGKSISKDGYTLTLDNVAADDNFVHVFYTVTSENEPFYNNSDNNAPIWSNSLNVSADIQCVINGKLTGVSNNNHENGYFVDQHTYKCAKKYNVSGYNIPNKFNLELFTFISKADTSEENFPVAFTKLLNGQYDGITDDDKNSVWYISTDIDKSKVKVSSITKDINLKLPNSDATVEKAVFSPFGNQLVISTPSTGDPDNVIANIDSFALYDENDTCLDILNSDLSVNGDGSSRNSLEFLKANKDTKQLKFVPVKYSYNTEDCDTIFNSVGTYPIEYKINDYGKVIVTGIRITDGEIDIDYYKDGFVPYDPAFVLQNDNGENAEPGDKFSSTLYTDVNYETNSYTARYVFEAYDDNGKLLPIPESSKADALKQQFTKLGVVKTDYYTLDFDSAVTVNLK